MIYIITNSLNQICCMVITTYEARTQSSTAVSRIRCIADTDTQRERVQHRVGCTFWGQTRPLLTNTQRGHDCERRRPKTKINILNPKPKPTD